MRLIFENNEVEILPSFVQSIYGCADIFNNEIYLKLPVLDYKI